VGSPDVDGLGLDLAPPLQLDLDAAGLPELGVELERLLRAVDRVSVDLADHVSVLEADLLVERAGTNGEDLESVRFPVLEGGDDARLGGERAQVGELALHVLAGDLVGVVSHLPNLRGFDLGRAATRGRRGWSRRGRGESLQ